MKRFLSWVVLCVLSAVVSIVLGLVSIVLVGIYNWLLSLNGIIKIIASWFVYCGIGSIHIVLPIMLSTYVMITSEKIRKSKNGIRYIICGAYAVFCLVLCWLNSGTITLPYTMFAVYGVSMIVQAIKKK